MNTAPNNNLPEVFAFVPSYNHAGFIEKCLTSIINQTAPPRKLLVIDDGSKDNSARIIERVLKSSPFESELIVRENRGLCATLNQGLSLSDGKYFAYLGSDDIWLPEFLEARTELLERRPEAILGYGHAFFIDEQDVIFDSTADYDENWANYPDGDAFPMLVQGIAPVSSTVFYRRSALEKVSWNEDSRLEDYEMYLKLSALGDFAFDKRILSTWRHHSYNTSKDKILMLNEVIEAQNRHFTADKLDSILLRKEQTKVSFRYARDFLQSGDKTAALKLARRSWRGAKSANELLKFGLRWLTPMSIVNAKRRQKKEKNFQQYQHLLSK
jgi:alpha-1,3-rhamnosyltransferase